MSFRRAGLALAIGGLVMAAAAVAVEVTVSGPRVNIRWREGLDPSDRATLERRHGLQNGEPDSQSSRTWQYELGDRSRANIRALLSHPAVEDTGYIALDTLTAPAPDVRVRIRSLPPLPGLPFPFSTGSEFASPRELFQIQSGWLLLAGGVLLWAARGSSPRYRRNAAIGMLLLVAATTFAFPIRSSMVRMGDSSQIADSRRNFEAYLRADRIRFEIHLSHAIFLGLDRVFGRAEDAPVRAQVTLARAAATWFVVSSLLVGLLERWSPTALRYLGLALLSPSALMYFGWREVGYLAMNIATFPLLVRGLAGIGGRLEVAGVLAGLGAALHGFGVLSLAGSGIAACAARAPLVERAARVLRLAAWGTTFYLGWLAVYVIVMNASVVPGDAAAIPWRHWLVDGVRGDRVNPAILSAAGGRDLLMTAWVVGVPLLLVAASLWRRYPDQARSAFWYSLPSVLFVVFFWPVQGLTEEMDLVFAAFPALYALCWVCAHDSMRTNIAAAVLVSAHLAFWRIVLDGAFVSMRVPAV